MTEEITFDDLMQDEEEFTLEYEKMIASIVKEFLEIMTSQGRVEFNKNFERLSGGKKVVVYSLIKKVLFNRHLENYPLEEITPKELEEKEELKISHAVSKKVFNRELSRFFDKNKKGYFIPNFKMKLALSYVKNGKSK